MAPGAGGSAAWGGIAVWVPLCRRKPGPHFGCLSGTQLLGRWVPGCRGRWPGAGAPQTAPGWRLGKVGRLHAQPCRGDPRNRFRCGQRPRGVGGTPPHGARGTPVCLDRRGKGPRAGAMPCGEARSHVPGWSASRQRWVRAPQGDRAMGGVTPARGQGGHRRCRARSDRGPVPPRQLGAEPAPRGAGS